MKLGEIVVRHGFVTPAQLEEGLTMQVSHGGRVGSNLIDLGYISVDNIARALGQQHNVPAASDEAFRSVQSSTLEMISRELCAKHGVLPLAVEEGVLHLAMRDPQRLALIHQLGERVGLKVQPYATPEVRLHYFLERLHEIPRPKRYRDAGVDREAGAPIKARTTAHGKDDSGRYAYQGVQTISPNEIPSELASTGPHLVPARLRQASRPTPTPPMAPKRVPVLTPHGVPIVGEQPKTAPPSDTRGAKAVAEDGFELVYLDEVERELQRHEHDESFEIDIDVDIGFDDESAEGQAEDDARASLPDVLENLESADDRESVIGQLLRPLSEEVSLKALLLVRGDLAVGLAASGTEVSRAQVRQLVVPLGADSLLKRALESKEAQHGPADALQQMIAAYLKAPSPNEACVAPVVLNNKVVNLVCSQSEGFAAPGEIEGALAQVTERAAEAYKRLILNKRGSRP